MEKFCIAGQATDDNMAHADCMPDNEGYTHTHTHRICNTYCFSTATVIARTRLYITEHCMSCYVFLKFTRNSSEARGTFFITLCCGVFLICGWFLLHVTDKANLREVT